MELGTILVEGQSLMMNIKHLMGFKWDGVQNINFFNRHHLWTTSLKFVLLLTLFLNMFFLHKPIIYYQNVSSTVFSQHLIHQSFHPHPNSILSSFCHSKDFLITLHNSITTLIFSRLPNHLTFIPRISAYVALNSSSTKAATLFSSMIYSPFKWYP